MSILSDLMNKRITFTQAAAEAASWAQKLVAHDPALTAVAGMVLADVKQAASNAIDLADKALGAIVAPAALSVEAAVNGAIVSAIGPAAVLLTPAVDSAIDSIALALKAEIDAAAFKAKAALVGPPPAGQ